MDQDGGLRFTMVEEEPQDPTRRVKIKVIGVGGAGGNAVNRMISTGLKGVDFVAVNTDYQDLEKSLAPAKMCIGQKLTRGLGTGGDPQLGEQAALEDTARLMEHLQGADLVFVAAGMGGGTGTGAAPVVARLSADAGALTVAVVTKPFSFEGKPREGNARFGLEQLMEAAATLIVIPNENLLANMPLDTDLEEAFLAADDILRQGVQGITDLITRPGRINLDFADARTVLSAGGRAVMGMGEASGEDRATQSAEKAANNPLLEDGSLQGARSVLINLTGAKVGLGEVMTACNFVREKTHPEANLIFGTSLDESMGDRLRVTVVAAAFDSSEARSAKRPSLVQQPQVAEAGAAFGAVPGVDTVLPSPASVASPPTGFLRGGMRMKGGLFGGAGEIPATPSGDERDYEQYQTPTFIRKSTKG